MWRQRSEKPSFGAAFCVVGSASSLGGVREQRIPALLSRDVPRSSGASRFRAVNVDIRAAYPPDYWLFDVVPSVRLRRASRDRFTGGPTTDIYGCSGRELALNGTLGVGLAADEQIGPDVGCG